VNEVGWRFIYLAGGQGPRKKYICIWGLGGARSDVESVWIPVHMRGRCF
jgi:hypothetical protein